MLNWSGPRCGTLERRASLPRRHPGEPRGFSAAVVAHDGSLRVTFDHQLIALSPLLETMWRVELPTRRINSTPTCLASGETLVAVDDGFRLHDARGELSGWIPCEGMDDSGPSPTITHSGSLVASSPAHASRLLVAGFWKSLSSVHGYDVPPPAVFDDDTLALSCYAGSGYCRVAVDDRVVWRAEFEQADLLPTINREQQSAVGSLNDHVSRIFDPDGVLVGVYPRASVFSEYRDGGWIALSDGEIARLTATGEPVWQREVDARRGWGTQALVDRDGVVFAPTQGGVTAFTPDGALSFSTRLWGDRPRALTPISEGELVLLSDDAVLVIAEEPSRDHEHGIIGGGVGVALR